MIKYNEQCLTIKQADLIGKPNKVNGSFTVGTIADVLTPVNVIFRSMRAAIPEQRLLTASNASGVVIATIPASLLPWFQANETYLVMIEKAGSGTLYDFQTSVTGPTGNAARFKTSRVCESGDITLTTRETATCTNC